MPGDTGGLAQFRGGTIAELIAFLNAVGRNRAIDFLKARSKWAPTDSLAERRTEESLVQSAETRSLSTRGSRMPHVGEDVFTIGHPKDYLWSFGQRVDGEGAVVGIVVGSATETAGVYFAGRARS